MASAHLVVFLQPVLYRKDTPVVRKLTGDLGALASIPCSVTGFLGDLGHVTWLHCTSVSICKMGPIAVFYLAGERNILKEYEVF